MENRSLIMLESLYSVKELRWTWIPLEKRGLLQDFQEFGATRQELFLLPRTAQLFHDLLSNGTKSLVRPLGIVKPGDDNNVLTMTLEIINSTVQLVQSISNLKSDTSRTYLKSPMSLTYDITTFLHSQASLVQSCNIACNTVSRLEQGVSP